MILHTPEAQGSGYNADCAGFRAARGSRRLLLRMAHADEVQDAADAVVVVVQAAPGSHFVWPVWYGPPWWPLKIAAGRYIDYAADDQGILRFIEECARRGH